MINTNMVIDQISSFVENIWFEEGEKKSPIGTPTEVRNKNTIDDRDERMIQPSTSHDQYDGQQTEYDYRSAANQAVIQAEKFKADVATPKGMELILNKFKDEREIKRFLDNDDDFFHVTCHIDPMLKSKIQAGEFVDLEKLLPRNRYQSQVISDSSDRRQIELITRGGHSYLEISQENSNEGKITGIRKWEQAFRTYAAIYTDSHPDQSGEIWQYVYTINLAASPYQWDDVAFYDFTFRQMMASKPWRSWAKTYTQGWNMAMRHTIDYKSNSSNSGGKQKSGQKQQFDWKDDCCWRFNKNKCG